MSNPTKYNIDITQGELYSRDFTYSTDGTTASPVNLTGYIARSQIREAYNSVESALSFSVSSGLGPNGVVSISAASGLTVALNYDKKYLWDLWVDNGTTAIPLLAGEVKVHPRVTK